MPLVLLVADFPLQAVLRLPPDQAELPGLDDRPAADRPAALFSDSTRRSVVLAANAPARAAGVAPGLAAPHALARCPGLLIRTARPDAEAEARAALLAAAAAVAPQVELTAPGVATLDVDGLAPAARVPAAAAALALLAALGLAAAAGLAFTPLLARLAARAAPAGTVREVAPADEAAFLAPLPLAELEPPPEVAAVLAGWGLRTCGELTAIPRDDLGRRLGAAGVALRDRAAGGAPRPLRPERPPAEFAAALELEHEVETLEPLLFLLRRLLDRLVLQLDTAGLAAAELRLGLALADESAHARDFRLPEPTRDAAVLLRTLHSHLESLRTAAPVTGLALRVEPVRPPVRQSGLFETGLRDPHGFAETLARVVAVVGSGRVGTPEPEDTHRPDAVRLVAPAAVVPPPAPPAGPAPLGRPLRRFRPPLAARLELTAGEPTYLWTEAFHGALAGRRGAWVASGGWWQEDGAWRRTEWDVALADGGLYRLVRTADGWFVEGEYD